MESSDYLSALRRRAPMIAVIVGFAVVVALVTTPGRPPPPRYKATANVTVHTGLPRSTALTLEPVSTEIVVGLATSGEVATRAKERLGFAGPPESLAAQIRAKTAGKTGIVNLVTEQPGEERALAVADTFAGELVAYLQERQDGQVQEAAAAITEQLEKLQDRAADLERQLIGASPVVTERVKLDRNGVNTQIKQVQQQLQQLDDLRRPDRAPVTRAGGASPTPVAEGFRPPSSRGTRALIAGLLGVALGAGLALVMNRLDPTVRTRRQAELAFGYPVIAEVPELPRRRRRRPDVVTASAPRSAAAEAYRNLRTATSLMAIAQGEGYGDGSGKGPDGSDEPMADSNGQVSHGSRTPPDVADRRAVIVVTSAGPGDGKTVSAANLAVSFAEAGNSVLLVGADMRQPGLHRYFDLPERAGSAGPDSEHGELRLREAPRPTSITGLSVIPGSRQPNPAELLPAQRERLVASRDQAEIIVVDTPPLLLANDAAELMRAADAVVLVGRCGHTTVKAAHQASELLHRLGMPVVGVVMIGLTSLPRSYRRFYDDGGVDEPRATGRTGMPTPVPRRTGSARAAQPASPSVVDEPHVGG